MKPINEVFSAHPQSVADVFQQRMGSTSFRIPIYQRAYRWSDQKIRRLVEDVCSGLGNIPVTNATKALSFIGTLILVDDDESREEQFAGHSLTVVDGQQRLTTLILLVTCLHLRLNELSQTMSEDDDVQQWLKEEATQLMDELFPCLAAANWNRAIRDYNEYIPVIVRYDSDVRADDRRHSDYKSPIGNFLYEYIKYSVQKDRGEDVGKFEYTPRERSERQKIFDSRWLNIAKMVGEISSQTGDEDESPLMPQAQSLIYDEHYRQLFGLIRTKHKKIIRLFRDLSDDDLTEEVVAATKLVAFGRYLLDRVAMTFVTVEDERYAFDIFEALNTTGESLTAIETFKPVVVEYQDLYGDAARGYRGSEMERIFEDIESYVERSGKAEDQQKVSRDLVILHALYSVGRRQDGHLSSQRNFLQETYRQHCADASGRFRFVRLLHDIVDFRQRFWDDGAFADIKNLGEETQRVYACLGLIQAMDTTLAIPALTRYWAAAEQARDWDLFVSSVKAIAAFLVFRRSATGDTANIDGDFRALMARGAPRREGIGLPLAAGLGSEPNELPGIEELQCYLRMFLAQPRVAVTGKDEWIGRVKRQPLKNRSAPLCRFLLLAAAEGSMVDPGQPYLLQRAQRDPGREFVKWDVWSNPDYASVEHIAPVSGPAGVWSEDIYSDPDFKHTIGNLALLPKDANSAIGKAGPKQKWWMYKAFSAHTSGEVEQAIENAHSDGATFSNTLKEIANRGARYPTVAGIGTVGAWNSEMIETRSRSLAERVWDNLHSWLGFPA